MVHFPAGSENFLLSTVSRPGMGPNKAQSTGFKGIKRPNLKVNYSPPPISEVQIY